MICSLIIYALLYWFLRSIVLPLGLMIFNFYVIAPRNGYIKLIKSCGEWAVVTGATDGIGREYCRQLAKIGMKIFLVGRDETKLQQTIHELKQYHKIDAKYYKADFCTPNIYEGLKEALEPLDIGILVNNVGMTQAYPCKFNELDADFSFFTEMLNCNIMSAVSMTKIVVPKMVERRRGIVVNISSASTLSPMTRNALYSASKSYLVQFSRTITHELRGAGVTVQTVLPFFVQTKFIGKFRPPRIMTPTADEYVASAIRMVGIESVCFGTPSHSFQGLMTNSIPEFLRVFMYNKVSSMREKAVHRD